MKILASVKLRNLSIIALAAISLQTAYAANQPTIAASSIRYNDVSARERLLANVPTWKTENIRSLFTAYQHPENYKINSDEYDWQYNAAFINAFWGVKNNPFVKFARPAKVFTLSSNTASSNYASFKMAPIVKSEDDSKYYVFDKNENAPIDLDSWVAKNRFSFFNICNGYGDTPKDSCTEKSFEGEVQDSIGEKRAFNNHATDATMANIPSAIRNENEDWRSKLSSIKAKRNANASSAYDDSVSWDDTATRQSLLNNVVTWPNYQTIKNNFNQLRDTRYFKDKSKANFLRRISWLYPDDGCWTRATAMIKDFFGPMHNMVNQYARPDKLFVFGNLCVNTSNAASGKVTWWYHTAPVVKDAETNQVYVLDPSVNAHEPLTIENWMSLVADKTGKCASSNASVNSFNICNSYGVSPSDSCKAGASDEFGMEASTELEQPYYQSNERQRQNELHRDADKVLGDTPPWLNG